MRDLSHDELSGIHYFFKGWQLMIQPGLRLFVIVPMLVNILLFASAFYWLFGRLEVWITDFANWLPAMLHWLQWLLWPLAIITIMIVFSFVFATIGNWIAAPFNGLLAERCELLLTGQPLPDGTLHELISDIPRTLLREWQKLCYWLPRALLLFAALWIPALGQTIVPFLWFIFSAWIMAIQYVDFAFDNHKIDFKSMRVQLGIHRRDNFVFGVIVMLATGLPFINWLVMPASVCGATALWVDRYRIQNLRLNQ